MSLKENMCHRSQDNTALFAVVGRVQKLNEVKDGIKMQ